MASGVDDPQLRERLGPRAEIGVHASGASWGRPKQAYRLMVDWPRWVAEGWVECPGSGTDAVVMGSAA